MFDKIIAYSVQNKFIIGLFMLALSIWGFYSIRQIPIDAVPDITNNQVMIITTSPTLATQEVEQFITTPIELSLQNLQNTEEIRSISRFGLSVITVVFEEDYDIYLARQLVGESLKGAQENIPEGLGTPELAPISTGLGEIYQYVVIAEEGYKDQYSLSDLRTIQDWIVKRQLSGIPGVAEINSAGGFLKQYEVAVNPSLLKAMGINITDVFDAMVVSNENTGGGYIEKNESTYYIRTDGVAGSLEDIGNIVVSEKNHIPVLIKDVAKVQYGKALRYGAMVRDAEEVVGGKVMMFKGANAAEVTELVKERVLQIQKSLPEGVVIEPYLVRDKLVSTAIGTVEKNLIEGGLIVIFILVILLGNWRAGLIVASVIPFAMLFAISMMNLLGISANLMSLGAIDFGLIVDGAVIIVESIVHRLHVGFGNKRLTQSQMDKEVISSSQKIRSSAAFGEIIILMVYIPILALVGIEGKMFKPMAQAVMLAIAGALILSLTYVPMMSALFLKKEVSTKRTMADRIIDFFQKLYAPILDLALRFKAAFVAFTFILFVVSLVMFSKMGGEFIPTLEEGDLAMQQILPPGSSLSQSVETAKIIQNKLLKEFPEIEDVVLTIGSSEIPTDPMPVEVGDYTLVMKPKSEWTSASSRQEMFDKIDASLVDIPGVSYDYSQPIQLRFNELMTGTKADIAIKLFGDDLDLLYTNAKKAEKLISSVSGVGSINVEQTIGMPQIIIDYNYDKMAQYGLAIKQVNQVVRTAFAGEKAGIIYEGEKRFDLVLRLDQENRTGMQDVLNLFITLSNGNQIPLSSVADISLKDSPMQISRENTNRRIVIGVNVGDTDVETLVGNIQDKLDANLELPSGYYFTYGGQFENLKKANARLAVALPLALAMIFILLYFTFGSLAQACLIFTAIPLSAIGGVWALELRSLPFSISAGIGFIALFGVAVLNGIVLLGYFNQLKKEGMTNVLDRIIEGTKVRLRPVLMTAAVASFGFLPMALSSSGGAEVQRPLATVVIGGLITATFLTLIILPILYYWLENWNDRKLKVSPSKMAMVLVLLLGVSVKGMTQKRAIDLETALEIAIQSHPEVRVADLALEQSKSLQNLRYNPGNTDFNFQADAINEKFYGQHVNQIVVKQSFQNPSLLKATNKLQDELATRDAINKTLTLAELKRDVRWLFYQIQFKKHLLELYTSQIETYAEYQKMASVRLNAGASNPMESLNLKAKSNEFGLLQSQTELELENLEKALQFQLNTQEAVITVARDEIMSYSTFTIEGIPQVKMREQEMLISKAQTDVLRSKMKPDFHIGYAAQNYYQGGWLSGAQAGISLPLFNGQTKKKIEAQKIAVKQAEAERNSEMLRAELAINAAQRAIQVYEKGRSFYKEQLETLTPEMVRVTQLNYEAGELPYLELLNTLQISANTQKAYLEQVWALNQAIANYQFLTNQ
ncbi:CusA/CzcA family heavy metal efflux RND transporter [Arcticibacterium luteifluviistationis]|uniref:CusA/CzcA family heavy metal efflux RND transporter n=1 Tax=Arcticibacterium luteifluviistationis TaxID=1784714 RepID=A0A2Z4GBV6_9BACT|nr:CusA/CzcA family heavy metal efflux RND transporter [Arcticibacterium luteifluviistationis]AWV98548.1 CusA/CzcA family heavy metal efflux RND transporter [Arcticibacterium luteifluviistationis]